MPILTQGARRMPFEQTSAAGYAAAFDIGTTTLVCYLLDRETGCECASVGMLNPQSVFGADVITRADAALQNGGAPLQAALLGGMNRLLNEVSAKAGIGTDAITLCCIAGNSCMQHLLLMLPLASLVSAPYAPHSLDAVVTNAAALGLAMRPESEVRVLPLIGGFVGADTVACLLSAEIWNLPGNTLLMDIGTNGELVLNAGNQRFACSAAAGPAFEGGNISCGMRGAPGAITKYWLCDDDLACSVLGGGKPLGICGSGLIDLIACLLRAGIAQCDGRMVESGPLKRRMRRVNGMRAFLLFDETETASGQPLLLTQKDVREVQLAKSALSSGIALLTDYAGIRATDIDRVLLAGAFGSYLNPIGACALGLLPKALLPVVHTLGNAAGMGACLAATSDEAFAFCTKLANETIYLDQAADASFQKRFLSELAFPAASVEE